MRRFRAAVSRVARAAAVLPAPPRPRPRARSTSTSSTRTCSCSATASSRRGSPGPSASERANAEWALQQVIARFRDAFAGIEDPYLREKAGDMEDIGQRVLRNLAGAAHERVAEIPDGVIVLARDLSPSDTAQMRKERVLGFAIDMGGKTSHTAIVARSLEIPAVVGLEDDHGAGRQRRPADHRRQHRAGLPPPRRGDGALLRGAAPSLPPLRHRAAQAARTAGRDARRLPDRPRGEHRAARGAALGARARRRRDRPLPHGVPLPQPRGHADRGGALRDLPPADRGDPPAAGDHPHLRPRRRQVPLAGAAREGDEPGARPAGDPLLPARGHGVQDPAGRDPARERARQAAGHVPDDRGDLGAAPGEGDPRRGRGRARSGAASPSTPSWRSA